MKIFPTLGYILALTAAVAAASPAFAPKTHASAKMLDLRGGAGPLDPEGICKFASVACLAQGALATLGPKLSNAQYGLPDELNDDLQQLHMKQLGTGVLSLGVMGYYLFFKDAPIEKAAKVNNVLWAYEMARNILSGDAEAGGYSDTAGLKASVALFIFMAYACTQDFAATAIKATSVFWAFWGVLSYVTPEIAKKPWSFADTSERSNINVQEFGVFLISTAILSGSLVFCDGMTKTQAWGLAALPWLLNTAKNLITDGYTEFGVNKNMMVAWLLLHIAVAGTTLF